MRFIWRWFFLSKPFQCHHFQQYRINILLKKNCEATQYLFHGTPEDQWTQFKIIYGKSYKSEIEEQLRFRVFAASLNVTRRMTEQSKGATRFGITQFSDLTPEEFSHLYLMKKQPKFEIIPGHDLEFDHTKVEIKPFWDWRYVPKSSGWPGSCVSPVYNQGQCVRNSL